MKDRGYTLVELLVTLTILSITAAVVVPALRPSDIEDSAAERVEGLFRLARRAALEAGEQVVLIVEPRSGRWLLEGANVDTTGLISVENARFQPSERIVARFSPTGAADAPVVQVSEGGRTRTLRLDRWTGRMSDETP